jgi:DNA-binding SARP family transcriptional activator
MMGVNMLRLLTFGGLALERIDGSSPPRVRPQRLAILAVLATAGDRGVSRERLSALFWPDADDERARHSLRQALYALRQELGTEVLQPDAILTLDRAILTSDISEFRAALATSNRTRAASLASGPFLQGFSLSSAPEFERWAEEERATFTAEATRVVLVLAKEAEASGDHDAATESWRRLTMLDPLSGRFALGYLKALASRGDRAGALAFARAHESVVQRELETDADPEIRRLEAELRAMPSPVVVRGLPAREPRPPSLLPAETGRSEPNERDPEARPAHALEVLPGTPDGKAAEASTAINLWRNGPLFTRVAAVLAVIAIAAVLTANLWGRVLRFGSGARTPTFAVGMIREDGVPDTLRIGGVLTDMLATNLARVAGLSVLANSRLFELMLPGQDTLVAGYSAAARRAGATEILQGRLLTGPQWGLAMEIQRVDLASGIVKSAYRVAANDRYALIDSMTSAITRDLRLGAPTGSVADATTESPIAYRLYEEGLRAYYQYDNAAARRLMESALQEDSTFAMAAYYVALLVPANTDEVAPRARALRLAGRAPERERLRISADMLALNMEPAAVAVAESLTTKFPDDPRSFELLSEALWFRGDWGDAAKAIERAIAMDSASEPVERQDCRLCQDYVRLADIYMWWDSLPAAEQTAQRYLRARPRAHDPWDILGRLAAARGDSTATRQQYRRFYEANPQEIGPWYMLRQNTLLEDYAQVEKDVQQFLNSPRPDDVSESRWIWSIVLRNQGRLAEALSVARQHRARDPNHLLEALVALEQGSTPKLVAIFDTVSGFDETQWPSAVRARHITWNKTLYGMALVAAGDTLTLRSLADTVEYWGQRSLYGRDRRAHHYLRGMLRVAERRDAEAAVELREAIHSPTNGFTRINYELGRTLLRLNRAAEAVPVVRAALHGGIDGSNLYVTRTDLHELLAEAFDRLGSRDSAAVHYGAVARAWARSDAVYRPRLDRARKWLTANRDAAKAHPKGARPAGGGG